MTEGEESMLFFFFFQAEDGIRYLTVTGVQTCALPISFPGRAPPDRRASTGMTERSRRYFLMDSDSAIAIPRATGHRHRRYGERNHHRCRGAGRRLDKDRFAGDQ